MNEIEPTETNAASGELPADRDPQQSLVANVEAEAHAELGEPSVPPDSATDSTDLLEPSTINPAPRKFAGRSLLGLLFWSAFATGCLLPYSYHLIRQFDPPIAEPEWLVVVMAASVVFEILISGVAILMGGVTGPAVGLTRILERTEVTEIQPKLTRFWRGYGEPFALGLTMGGVLGIFATGNGAVDQNTAAALSIPPAWQGMLASLGAAIREEIWFRFGLMTFSIWLIAKFSHRFQSGPLHVSQSNVRISNSIAAVAFSIVHLPQAGSLIGLDNFVILFVMLGNGLPGLVFGWLFWYRGLIAAMLAHFSFDIVLKVILPLLATS
jgi:hypothetical protein